MTDGIDKASPGVSMLYSDDVKKSIKKTTAEKIIADSGTLRDVISSSISFGLKTDRHWRSLYLRISET